MRAGTKRKGNIKSGTKRMSVLFAIWKHTLSILICSTVPSVTFFEQWIFAQYLYTRLSCLVL